MKSPLWCAALLPAIAAAFFWAGCDEPHRDAGETAAAPAPAVRGGEPVPWRGAEANPDGAPFKPPAPGILAVFPGAPRTAAAAAPAGGGARPPAFIDRTEEVGIHHRHLEGEFDPGLARILPWIASLGASAAAADVDGDGDCDFYATTSRRGAPNALFLNQRFSGAAPGRAPGPLRFIEAARAAGIAEVNDASGISMDAVFGDLDSDGDLDLYVVQWGVNRLFENTGGGRFEDRTAASGAGDPGNGVCGLPFDYDNDGDLDLFVCNYYRNVDLSRLDGGPVLPDSFESARNGGPDAMLRNDGGLRFHSVARELRLDDTGWSMDAGITDIDNDGDMDLYVAASFGPDRLYLNNGDGTFADISRIALGPRAGGNGNSVDCGDLDGDGFTDIYAAGAAPPGQPGGGSMLWLNNRNRSFADAGRLAGVADAGWGWCARLFDYDLDGDLDILALNGFISGGPESFGSDLAVAASQPSFRPEEASRWPDLRGRSLSGGEASRLFRNRGGGVFQDAAAEEGLLDRLDGRGAALADFDGDGDLDIAAACQRGPVLFYLNQSGPGAHWASFRLRGSRSNRDAIGARAEIAAGELRLVREVNGVNGFASASDLALHFGLGAAGRIDRATIFWPSGAVSFFKDLPADRLYIIEERGEPLPPAHRLPQYLARPEDGIDRWMTARRDAAPFQDPAGPGLAALERELRRRPRNLELGSSYSAIAAGLGAADRAIELFRELAETWPGGRAPPALRLQLALALGEKLAAASTDGAARELAAAEALQEIAGVIEDRPESYAARFAAGIIQLRRGGGPEHAREALRHLEFCAGILDASSRGDAVGPVKPYLDRPHWLEVRTRLGDAAALLGDAARARAIWNDSLDGSAADGELKKRLALDDTRLAGFCRGLQGPGRPLLAPARVLESENDLSRREAEILRRPDDRAALNAYRLEAAELYAYSRSEAFLDRLAEEFPRRGEPRLQAALAILDRLLERSGTAEERNRDLEASLRRLEMFRSLQAADWAGPCFRGVVSLWKALRQEAEGGAPGGSPGFAWDALQGDFLEAGRLSRRTDGRPRLELPGLARGDILALGGRPDLAREAWAALAASFPASDALQVRIRAPDGALPLLIRSAWLHPRNIWIDLDALADTGGDLDELESSLSGGFLRRNADRYRVLVRRAGDPDRAVAFFQAFFERNPEHLGARLQLALSLLDRIPDRDLGPVRKGQLSNRALAALAPVLEARPDSWALSCLAGDILLRWPLLPRRSAEAITRLERAARLAGTGPAPAAAGAAGLQPECHRAWGDACIVDDRMAGARAAWEEGRARFPGDRGLEERLGLAESAAQTYVERRRAWRTPVDTAAFSDAIGDLPPAVDPASRRAGN